MRGVTVDIAGVVEQIVHRGDLALLVHFPGPVVEVDCTADEVSGGDDGVRMKR